MTLLSSYPVRGERARTPSNAYRSTDTGGSVPTMSRLTYRFAVLLAAAALTAGCAGDDRGSAADDTSDPAPTTESETMSTEPTDLATPAEPIPVGERCDTDLRIDQDQVAGPGDDVLNVAFTGKGSTTVLLLHQTDGDGMCGFMDFAGVLADRGVRVMLADLCGYGDSECTKLTGDTERQVGLLAERARRGGGVQRLVVVGASMGGSVAAHSAAAVDADAMVDLSGPVDYGDAKLRKDARTLTMPSLFAFSREDPDDLAAARRLVRQVPAEHVLLLERKWGHGYTMLGKRSPVRAAVLDWVAGDYS